MTKFTITDAAARRILELLQEPDAGTGFRVSVKGGGCSGFQYDFDYKTLEEADDAVFLHADAIVYIDPISTQFLDGATLDFAEDLSGAKFIIQNPNATAKCGCGKSFS